MTQRNCWICNKQYPLTEEYFYKNINKRDGWGTECKPCHKASSQMKRTSRKSSFVSSKGNKCNSCNLYYEDHKFFDIDHIIPLFSNGDKRRQYIYDDNSQVLCPNCHRLKTIKDMKWGKYETKS